MTIDIDVLTMSAPYACARMCRMCAVRLRHIRVMDAPSLMLGRSQALRDPPSKAPSGALGGGNDAGLGFDPHDGHASTCDFLYLFRTHAPFFHNTR